MVIKRLRWGRIALLLVVLVLIGAGVNFCVRYAVFDNLEPADNAEVSLSPSSGSVVPPESMLDKKERSMKETQNMIEQARRKAVEAAKASGQLESEAQKFGDIAAQKAKDAFLRPLAAAQ